MTRASVLLMKMAFGSYLRWFVHGQRVFVRCENYETEKQEFI